MAYTDYKQQYAYGFGPLDLAQTFSSSSTVFFAGDACGLKSYLSTANESTKTLPIDLKAEKQMFSKKALLKIKCLEAFAPVGTKQTLTIAYSGTAGADGSSVWHIYGESPVTVAIENGTTATNAGKAAKAALAGLVNWDVSESSGTVTLTRKVPAENVTATDATKFSVTDISSTTQTLGGQTSGSASFTAGTSGVAPEADTTHILKLDICSSDEAPSETSEKTTAGIAYKNASVYIHPQALANQDLFEITMPSDLKRYTWLEVSMPGASSTTMTAGKLLVHFIPNLV